MWPALPFLRAMPHPCDKECSTSEATLRKAIADYLTTGGFPEVLHLVPNLRVEVLQGYIDSIILKDVVIERHRVSNVIALKHLVSHVMHAPGGKFSVNRFYNTLSRDLPEVKHGFFRQQIFID